MIRSIDRSTPIVSASIGGHPANEHEHCGDGDLEHPTSKSGQNHQHSLESEQVPTEKPKRPLSAYNLFFRDQRELLLEKLPSPNDGRCIKRSHGKINFKDLAKTIAAKWKEISPADKEKYESIAAVGRAKYMKQAKLWKKEQRKLAKQLQKRKKEGDDGSTSTSYIAPPTSISFPASVPVPESSDSTFDPVMGEDLSDHSSVRMARSRRTSLTFHGEMPQNNMHSHIAPALESVRIPAIAPIEMRPVFSDYLQHQPSVHKIPPRTPFSHHERAVSMPEPMHSSDLHPVGPFAQTEVRLQQGYEESVQRSLSLSGPRSISWGQPPPIRGRSMPQIFPTSIHPRAPPQRQSAISSLWDASVYPPQNHQYYHNNHASQPLPFAPESQFMALQSMSETTPVPLQATAAQVGEWQASHNDWLPPDAGTDYLDPLSANDDDTEHPFAGLFDDP